MPQRATAAVPASWLELERAAKLDDAGTQAQLGREGLEWRGLRDYTFRQLVQIGEPGRVLDVHGADASVGAYQDAQFESAGRTFRRPLRLRNVRGRLNPGPDGFDVGEARLLPGRGCIAPVLENRPAHHGECGSNAKGCEHQQYAR